MNLQKLIERCKKEHLLSITFDNDKITIKKQEGNTNGYVIEIDFNEEKQILDIRFNVGNYNSATNIKESISKMIAIINDNDGTRLCPVGL